MKTPNALAACLLLALVTLLAPQPSLATGNNVEKYALVIGNRDYEGSGRDLANTIRDANQVAQALKKLEFNVTQRSNLTRSQMFAEVANFSEQLPEGATAFVYYAGHGMQLGGSNYLMPVDMLPTSEQSVSIKAYPLKILLERLSKAKSAVNIVVLDACRDNPFQPASPVRYRSFADLGLIRTQAPRGTLLAYSTAPGQLAADGKDAANSYAAILARTLQEPKLEIRQIFDKVASQMRLSTQDDQIPWYETSLTDHYFFLPPDGVTVVAGKPLIMADAGRRNTGYRSDKPADNALIEPWFLMMSPGELDKLHRGIEHRVSQMTADEIPELEHKANGGNLKAQTELGLVYHLGIDKEVNLSTGAITRKNAINTKAMKWLTQAAEAGFPPAQVELAEMYFKGRGVEKDRSKTRYWIEKAAAADKNYARAQISLCHINLPESEIDNPFIAEYKCLYQKAGNRPR
jgi:hypothetical protein